MPFSILSHTLLAFLVAISILIVFHELGHFLVARWCGVKVLRFSLGFGKILFMRRFGKDQTEWALSAIPLGGYVKMLGEHDDKTPETKDPRAFGEQSLTKRSLIVAAGPVANLLLAVFLFWILFVAGTEEIRPILGTPVDGSPAAITGFSDGDQITAIDETPITTWKDVHWTLFKKATSAQGVDVRVVTASGEPKTLYLNLDSIRANGWEENGFANLGLRLYSAPAVIYKLHPDSPAQQAGLKPGDIVQVIDGTSISNQQSFVERIQQSPEKTLNLQIERDGQPLTLSLTPQKMQKQGKIIGFAGIEFGNKLPDRMIITARYTPWVAFERAATATWDTSAFTVKIFGKILTGNVSLKNISGPITIADVAGKAARAGWTNYIHLLAFVSIAIGILNLLPIPILDGGLLLYHAIEFIKRSPITERTQIIGQKIGIVLLFALMVLAFYNDINRLISHYIL